MRALVLLALAAAAADVTVGTDDDAGQGAFGGALHFRLGSRPW